MNKGFIHSVLLVLLLGISSVLHADLSQKTITLAYMEEGLPELKTSDKQIALQLLANELVKGTDLKMLIRAVHGYSEMQDLISQTKIDYVILNTFHYFTHSAMFLPYMGEQLWAIQRGALLLENYVVVAHKRDAGLSLENFRGRRLSIHKPYILMGFYLQYLVQQAHGNDAQHFFSKVKETRTASQGVLDVYFGSAALSVVPKHIYDLTTELNPLLRKNLVILQESGHIFLPVLIFNFKHLDAKINQQVSANLAALDQSVRGEQILNMFDINAIKRVTREQLNPMRFIFNEYKPAKNK